MSRLRFLNQTRQKIGVTYGSNLTTTGGTALKFYASVRMEIRRIGPVKDGELVVGNKTRVKVVKNKLAPPFRQAEFEIQYGKGINSEAEILDLGLEKGLIHKSGAWYSLGDQQLGQGRVAACRWLSEHAEVREKLVERCLMPAETKGGAPADAKGSEPDAPTSKAA